MKSGFRETERVKDTLMRKTADSRKQEKKRENREWKAGALSV